MIYVNVLLSVLCCPFTSGCMTRFSPTNSLTGVSTSLQNAYNYSNPFQQTPSSASRSTFTAASSSSPGYQVIFSGLPLDVSEKDLA